MEMNRLERLVLGFVDFIVWRLRRVYLIADLWINWVFRSEAERFVAGRGGAQSLYDQFIAFAQSMERLGETACPLLSVKKEPGISDAHREEVAADVVILKEKIRKKKIGENGEPMDCMPMKMEEMPGKPLSSLEIVE
jgi:hypothetical protein